MVLNSVSVNAKQSESSGVVSTVRRETNVLARRVKVVSAS
jgi:hypothetical protein